MFAKTGDLTLAGIRQTTDSCVRLFFSKSQGVAVGVEQQPWPLGISWEWEVCWNAQCRQSDCPVQRPAANPAAPRFKPINSMRSVESVFTEIYPTQLV